MRTRQHDRIGRAFVDMGEMRPRRRRIVAVAQRDPAAHEMEIGAVMVARRHRRAVHDIVGGIKVVPVEQFTGEAAPLAPPFVGVLLRHGLRRRGQHEAGRLVDLVVTHQPFEAAERVAEIATCFARNAVELVERLVGCACRTGLYNRNLLAAKPPRGATGAGEILGTDPLVHPRAMILARQQIAERLQRVGLGTFRQFIRPPGLAHQARGSLAIAFGQKNARERELALRAQRLIADKAANRGGIAALLPQPRLGPPAQLRHARPAGIVGNEGGVAAEFGVALRMAQHVPFHELLRRRIADSVLYGDRVAGLAAARQIDRILHQRKIAYERRRGLFLGRRMLMRDA
jgi:hypothetical protein